MRVSQVSIKVRRGYLTAEFARAGGSFLSEHRAKACHGPAPRHKRQAKRLHRTAARRRKDALHKFSRKIVNEYQTIKIGDVSSLKLAKTPMAKSVLDAGWGMLKMQLQYKGQQGGRSVIIVNESDAYVASTKGDALGDFANHCASCGAVIGDIDLHSEPDHAFFNIVHSVDGAVTLVPLPQPIRLSGNEHFVID